MISPEVNPILALQRSAVGDATIVRLGMKNIRAAREARKIVPDAIIWQKRYDAAAQLVGLIILVSGMALISSDLQSLGPHVVNHNKSAM
jgi:hypothetical protein